MNLIDLTHSISANMPVYPGTEPPIFTTECSIDSHGFLEKKLTFYSHTGTHMDAPAHMIKGSKTLDQLAIDRFYGPAVRVDVSTTGRAMVDIQDLVSYADKLDQNDFLLIHTGWGRQWGTDAYFSGFPVMTAEAAKWIGQFDLKGLGMDVISVDRAHSEDFPIHKLLLENDTVIIENLKDLDLIPVDRFIFACFPLKFRDADGAPVRAVALCG